MTGISVYPTNRTIGKNWDAAVRDIDNPTSSNFVPYPDGSMSAADIQKNYQTLLTLISIWEPRTTTGNSKEQANAGIVLMTLQAKQGMYEDYLSNSGIPKPPVVPGNSTPPILPTTLPTVTNQPTQSATGTDTKKILQYGVLAVLGFLAYKRFSK